MLEYSLLTVVYAPKSKSRWIFKSLACSSLGGVRKRGNSVAGVEIEYFLSKCDLIGYDAYNTPTLKALFSTYIGAFRISLFAHPLFVEQCEALTDKVEKLKAKDPTRYKKKNATKRLAAIHKLAFEIIPQDPTKSEYRQVTTLGDNNKHWFRATFFQQYRLFFRYHQSSKVIVYAWVNDEKTLRAYESKNDIYKVFSKMLASGNPPDDWETLLKSASSLTSTAQ